MIDAKVGQELAEQIARAVQKIYIFAEPLKACGLSADVLYGTYQVVVVADGKVETLFEFSDQATFVSWLENQTDVSLAALALEQGASALSLQLLSDAAARFQANAIGADGGPYRIEHPKGGFYSVPPIHFACLTKNLKLFKEAFARSSKEDRMISTLEGTALGAACSTGFIQGAETLIQKDGYCCSEGELCLCLSAALTNQQWPIVPLFRSRIPNEDALISTVAPHWSSEILKKVQEGLLLPEIRTPYFFNCLLRDDDPPSSAVFLRELNAFPRVDLNKKEAGGWTPFLRYLLVPTLDLVVVKKMIELGANPLATDQSALDILVTNKFCDQRERARVGKHLYSLGARSSQRSIIKRYLTDWRFR